MGALERACPVWAKLGIYAAVTFALMLAASFAGFFAGNVVLAEHWDFHLSHPGVLRSVFGAAISLTAVCMLGTALGFILRNTAGAISALFGILLVLPLVGELRPEIAQYLPGGAKSTLVTARIGGDMMEPLPALALLCTYAGAAIGGAVLMLRRRDA